jgi:hypothetical protein
MAVFSRTKLGFVTIPELLVDLDNELTKQQANGKTYFTRKYGAVPTTSVTTGKWIYEATPDCDPLADYQLDGSNVTCGWRICFNLIDVDRLAVHLGTAIQYPDSGTIAFLNDRREQPVGNVSGDAATFPANLEPPGNLSESWKPFTPQGAQSPTYATPDPSVTQNVWLNRKVSPQEANRRAYPMSYMLSMTNRGMYLGVWEDSQEEIPQSTWETTNGMSAAESINTESADGYGKSPFRWFVVQRSVDRLTGHVRGGGALRGDNDPGLELSRCPVFCVGGTSLPKQLYKFIVRENDVVSPSRRKYAAFNSTDSPAVLNPFPQNSITESGEYVVTFINNLSTPRFRYSDELDMVGTVGADVVGGGTKIQVYVYGETKPRTYTAAYATRQYGTGMRIMVLTDGHDDVEDSHIRLAEGSQSATITANVNTVNEGGTVRFTVSTTNIVNFSRIYWRQVGTANSADFTDSSVNGYTVVQNNVATIDRRITSDANTDGFDTIQLEIRKEAGTTAPLLAISDVVSIVDTSRAPTYTVLASHTSVDEGANVKFTIETTDVNNGTLLYWNLTGVSQADVDQGRNVGSVTINTNRAEVTVGITSDFLTEATPETITFNLRTSSDQTKPTVATQTVLVNDVSQTATYSFVPNVTVATEGDTISYTITTTNIPNGTTLYWDNVGTTSNADFTATPSGTVTVTGNTASVAVTLATDSTTEGGETIALVLRRTGATGPVEASASVVTIASNAT